MARFELPPGAEPVKDEEVQLVAKHFDLTPAGARLLAVMAREGSEKLTNRMKCALADISEDWFYALVNRDEKWKDAYRAVCVGELTASVLDVNRALVKKAKEGDTTAAKMIWESTAFHTPTVKHEVEHKLNDKLLEMYRQSQQQKIPEKTFIDVEAVEKE